MNFTLQLSLDATAGILRFFSCVEDEPSITLRRSFACDNQAGRKGFTEETGAVDRGEGDERAKPCKL